MMLAPKKSTVAFGDSDKMFSYGSTNTEPGAVATGSNIQLGFDLLHYLSRFRGLC